MVSILWCMSIPLSHASVVQTLLKLLPSLSLLCSMHDRPMNWRMNYRPMNQRQFGWLRRYRLMSQNIHFMGSGCQVLLWIRKQSKKSINLASISKGGKPQAGDVFISLFLTSPDGQGSEQRLFRSKVRQRGRILWGGPLCMILMTKTTKSKSKKQNQNWFFHAIQYHKENSRNYCTEAFQTDRL